MFINTIFSQLTLLLLLLLLLQLCVVASFYVVRGWLNLCVSSEINKSNLCENIFKLIYKAQ